MSEQKKKALNIIVADGSNPQEYINYLNLIFDVTVLNISEVENNRDVDLILFTGGADVNPEIYEEPVGKYTSFNNDRDNIEIDVFHRFRSKPKLGICRGSQLLTVLAGGQLIQHVEGHGKEHDITIKGYGTFKMISTHHQMMYPFKLNSDKFELIAWASKYQSDTYLDGNNEEIKTSIDFLEPEIVEYPNIKSFCIQGHPENARPETKDITLMLISRFLEKYEIEESSNSFLKYKTFAFNPDQTSPSLKSSSKFGTQRVSSLKFKEDVGNVKFAPSYKSKSDELLEYLEKIHKNTGSINTAIGNTGITNTVTSNNSGMYYDNTTRESIIRNNVVRGRYVGGADYLDTFKSEEKIENSKSEEI